jgi:hypothetical protein
MQAIAGLAAGEARGDGDEAGVDRDIVGVGTGLGVGDGVGVVQPASKVQSRTMANIFIVNGTVRGLRSLRKDRIGVPLRVRTDARTSAELRRQPAHCDRHRPSTFAHLVERLHLGRLNEIRDELLDSSVKGVGIIGSRGIEAVELG